MKKEIAVSVIVPVFNVEKYVSRCIDSILNQTLKNIEIIIIDDGSTDKSLNICKEYESKNTNINVIHQENMGLTAVRRKGLSVAKGEFAVFVDSDDYISESMCEDMYTYCKENNLKLLISNYYLVKDNSCEIIKGYLGNNFSIQSFYESISPGFVWNKMYHRTLFDRMKVNINVNQAEDICMLLPLLSTLSDDEVGYIDTPFYFYSLREDSNSNSRLFAQNCSIEEYLSAIKYILDNHDVRYSNYVVYYCVQCIYWGINNPDKVEFKADYIEFIQKELASYIIGNVLLTKFTNLGSDLVKSIIPSNLYYVNYSDDDNNFYELYVDKFKNYNIEEISINSNKITDAPKCVQEAYKNGNIDFVKEFLTVKKIKENGGIFISSKIKLVRALGEVRVHRAFTAYKSNNEIGMDIWGSIKEDTFVSKLYESYFEDSIFNKNLINLTVRSNIILQKFFKLKLKGVECFLMTNQVKIYEPNKFYVRTNSEYISYFYNKLDEIAEKEGKVIIDYQTYKSMIINMNNKEDSNSIEMDNALIRINQLEQEVLNYTSMYETVLDSTCWKITKPIRVVLDFFRRNHE